MRQALWRGQLWVFCYVSKALLAILDGTEKLLGCQLTRAPESTVEVASYDLQHREELVWNSVQESAVR